jgi:hypothetical protein
MQAQKYYNRRMTKKDLIFLDLLKKKTIFT